MQLEHQFPGGPQLKLNFFLCALHPRSSPAAGLGRGGRGLAAVPGGSPQLGGGHGALLPSLQQMVAHCRLRQARPQPCLSPAPAAVPSRASLTRCAVPRPCWMPLASSTLQPCPRDPRPPHQPSPLPATPVTLLGEGSSGTRDGTPRFPHRLQPQGAALFQRHGGGRRGKGPCPALLCAVLPGGPELALEALKNCFLLACKRLFSAHFWSWAGTSLCAQWLWHRSAGSERWSRALYRSRAGCQHGCPGTAHIPAACPGASSCRAHGALPLPLR